MADVVRTKLLVVSAVNLVEGGTLAVMQQFLRNARAQLGPEWRIIALAHRESLVPPIDDIEVRVFPKVKTSWLRRVWFEYSQCRTLSRQLNADLWIAMHDMTPRVQARRQAVYCHNPAPFYKMTLREAWLDPKLVTFKWLYGLVYRINLRRNYAVIVQQEWLREEFRRRYGARNVVVAHPVDGEPVCAPRPVNGRRTVFLYPALARPFKNFELLCEAVLRLDSRSAWHGELRLTIDGSENAYARELVRRYSSCSGIHFIGLQDGAGMRAQYAQAHCLVFPSRRETWGLPLTEAKAHGLSILAADLPYAHESVGCYERVDFFGVDEPDHLAEKMAAVCDGTLVFPGQSPPPPVAPYASDWRVLVNLVTQGL